MIKLKTILNEGYAWEREAGKPLPTLEQTTAAYAAKLAEQSAEQAISNPMEAPLQEQGHDFVADCADYFGMTEEEFEQQVMRSGAEFDVIERIMNSDSLSSDEAYAMVADMANLPMPSNEQINNKFGRRGKFGPGSRYNDEPDFDKPQSVVYQATGRSNKIINSGWDKLVDKYNSTPGFKVETDITSKRYVAKITNNATGNWWEVKFKFNEWSYTCQVDGKYKWFDDNNKFIDNFNEVNALSEAGVRPDYIDLDGDGDEQESMRKAAADREAMEESFHRRLMGNLKGHEYILSETFSRK